MFGKKAKRPPPRTPISHVLLTAFSATPPTLRRYSSGRKRLLWLVPDGRIKILFEKHWVYKFIPDKARTNAVKSGLAWKKWINPANVGYMDQARCASMRLRDGSLGILLAIFNCDRRSALHARCGGGASQHGTAVVGRARG